MLAAIAGVTMILAILPTEFCGWPTSLCLWLIDHRMVGLSYEPLKVRTHTYLEPQDRSAIDDLLARREAIDAVARIASRISGRDREKIGADTQFEKELCICKDKKIELLMAIEEEFNKEISDDCGLEIVDIEDAARVAIGSLTCRK